MIFNCYVYFGVRSELTSDFSSLRCTPLMIAVLFLANPTQISHRLCNDHMREKPIPRLAEGAVCHTPKGEGGRYLLIQHPDRPLGGRTRKDLDVVPLVSMYASGKKYSICLSVLHNKFDELLYVLHDQGIRSSTAGVPVHTWQKSFDEVARFDGFKAARPNAMEKQERFSADAESLVAKDRGRLLPFLGGLAVFCGGEQCVLCAAGECHNLAHYSHVQLRPAELSSISTHSGIVFTVELCMRST